MGEIADLFATLGVKIDNSWANADEQIKKTQRAMDGLDRVAKELGVSRGAVTAAARAAVAAERAAAREQAALARTAAAAERASARTIAAKEREAAAAARAARSQEREQARSAAAQARSAARAEAQRVRAEARRTRRLKQIKAQRAEIAGEFIGGVGMVATAGLAVAGLAAYLGERVVKAGIDFNSTMEDSKNEVAGMLALANKSHLSDELKNADMLVDHLRERAAKLPGTTQEYIQMLAMITQPLTDAKLGLKELEDLTVQSTVAAKGLHVPWEVAARDIDQAIRGQFHSTDPFSGKVLGSIGYKGEEGRSRFNQLSQERRAKEFQRALMQSQFTELGEAAGKSFSGRLSTLQDAWEHFTGVLAKPLFEKLIIQFERLNNWLDKNQDKVDKFAHEVGGVLGGAFEVIVGAFEWLIENGSAVWTGIKIAVGALIAPFAFIGAQIYAIIEGIKWLIANVDKLADLPGIRHIIDAAHYVFGSNDETDRGANGATAPTGGGVVASAITRVPSISPGKNDVAMSVDVGGINVTSNASDPVAVAQEVHKAFDERLSFHLRRTYDEVA